MTGFPSTFADSQATRPALAGAAGWASVSVLFARRDSIYKKLGVDTWDIDRDARNWPGGRKIVAHPPCRGWGCLRANSKHTPEEKALGPWAVAQVQKWGGVLEHPARSSLWKAANLPRPGSGFDQHGGFTLDVDQHWWGHRAQKRTWLYVCGITPGAVPAMPLVITRAPCVINNIHGLRAGQPGYRSHVTKREREATPPALAEYLLNLAALCRPNGKAD